MTIFFIKCLSFLLATYNEILIHETCKNFIFIICTSDLRRWVSCICRKNVPDCSINHCSVKVFWNKKDSKHVHENVNLRDVAMLRLSV